MGPTQALEPHRVLHNQQDHPVKAVHEGGHADVPQGAPGTVPNHRQGSLQWGAQ